MNSPAHDLGGLPGLGIKPLLSLRRHSRAAWVTLIVALVLGAPLAILKGRSFYVAEAVFQVSPAYMKNLEVDKELELQSNSQYREYVNHLSRSVVRYDVIEAALQTLKREGVDLKPSALTQRQYIEQLQRRVYVRAVPDTYMVRIGAEDLRREHLDKLINAIADTFVRTTRAEQIYGSGERLDVLQERATRLANEIEALGAERVKLAERLNLTTFAEHTVNPYDTTLIQVRERLALAANERALAEAALDAYNRQHELPMHLGRSLLETRQLDNGLQALRNEVTKRREELHRVMAGLEERHPARQAAQTELLQLNGRLKSQEEDFDRQTSDNLRSRLQATLAARMQVEREARLALAQLQDQAADFARNFQSAMRLTGEIRKREAEAGRLRDRLNYLDTESQAIGWVRLVTRALPADTPQGLGKKRMLLLTLLAALGLALAVPVGLDLIDPRLRTVNDAEKLLGLPSAGWQVRRADRSTEVLWQEQGRRFAATLLRNGQRDGQRAFAFTGVKSAAGVSELVRDTASLLNRLGARTLVVEADPRPGLPKRDSAVGLSDYLAQSCAFEELIQESAWREGVLDRVCVGQQASDGLKRVDRLREAMDQWSAQYDFVLVDLPPLLLSADAELLIEAVGHVFLVVEADGVSRGEALRARRLLEKLQPRGVGLFVNKVTVFPNSGYMQQLIVETATRMPMASFMTLSRWRLWFELARVRFEMWRREPRRRD